MPSMTIGLPFTRSESTLLLEVVDRHLFDYESHPSPRRDVLLSVQAKLRNAVHTPDMTATEPEPEPAAKKTKARV